MRVKSYVHSLHQKNKQKLLHLLTTDSTSLQAVPSTSLFISKRNPTFLQRFVHRHHTAWTELATELASTLRAWIAPPAPRVTADGAGNINPAYMLITGTAVGTTCLLNKWCSAPVLLMGVGGTTLRRGVYYVSDTDRHFCTYTCVHELHGLKLWRLYFRPNILDLYIIYIDGLFLLQALWKGI